MTRAEKSLLNAILREDFFAFLQRCFMTLNPGAKFLPNWHLELLCHYAQLVQRREMRRLIVNLPPRHLKSLTLSVALPAFVLGHDPTRRIIVASYGAELAVKLANEFRHILNAAWYKTAFPDTRVSRMKNTENEVVTTKGGFRLATSVDGTLTGRGGDIIIVDDPLKPSDALSEGRRAHVNEWYRNTLLPRLDDKMNGAIVIVMQRLHVADLCGDLLNGSDQWTHLKLPAIAQLDERFDVGQQSYRRKAGEPLHLERDPIGVLDSLRAQLGPDIFAAQYLQEPVPPGGNMVKRDWVRRYDGLPARTSSTHVIQSWDTASKTGKDSDYSVCTTWLVIDARYYLADVLRGRFDYPTLKAQTIAHGNRHRPTTILIEDSGVGPAVAAELSKRGFAVKLVRVEHNKETRMSIQSGKFASGQVYLPNEAPWLGDCELELFAFPGSQHDDQIDSISQALSHQIESYLWNEKSLKGFADVVHGLAMDNYFGRLMGRPW